MDKYEIGDVVFVHDKRWYNPVSTSIMIAETDSLAPFKNKVPYHVAGVYDGRGMLIESTWGSGVHEIELEHYTNDQHMIVWAKRIKHGIVADDQRRLHEWFYNQIGKKYDKSQIIGIFWRSFLRVIPPVYRFLKKRKQAGLDQRYEFICSELVFRAYKEVLGINLYPRASASNVTPYDLDRSELLENVG